MEYDFKDGKGLVPAHKHPNGGGWVADSAKVSDKAYVGPEAQVFGEAEVYGKVAVSGKAMVYGNARVSGDAWVYGNVVVSGGARVIYGVHVTTPTQVTRSDGFTFTLQSGRIVAGCRDFDMKEAESYWCDPNHHMYEESRRIFNFLKSIHNM